MVLVGQGSLSLSNFLTVLALGRWGGASDLGQFALGWSVYFLAGSLADTLVFTPYTFHASQKVPIAADLPGTSAVATGLMGLLWLVALSLVSAASLWWVPAWSGLSELAGLWPVLPLAIAAGLARELVRRHQLCQGRAPALMAMDVLGSLILLGLVGALATQHQLTATTALAAQTLAALLTVLPWLSSDHLQRLKAAWPSLQPVMRDYLAYGHWLLMGGLCHVLSVQAYPWLALAHGGTQQAGLQAACAALMNLISPLLTGLTNHYRPRYMQSLAHEGRAAFMQLLRHSSVLFLAPALLLWLGTWAVGEQVLTLLYGPDFRAAAVALPWQAMGVVAVALAAPLQLALLAVRAPTTNLIHHGSAILMLGLGAWVWQGQLDMLGLGRLQGIVGVTATAVLAFMFWRHVIRKP
jgi:O-antigen/teichoic acid export membrane protein